MSTPVVAVSRVETASREGGGGAHRDAAVGAGPAGAALAGAERADAVAGAEVEVVAQVHRVHRI